MDWWLYLTIILGLLVILFALRLPVAFSFLAINVGFAYFLWGGGKGLQQVAHSYYSSVGNFIMSPLPAFILLGEILFLSKLAIQAIDAIDQWMGRLPGRLGLISVINGVVFAALCGSSVGSTAMLGSVLTPEMERRGYGKPISLGPIMAAGGMAQIIPPSMSAVLIGTLADVSIEGVLISGILPGIVLGSMYAIYIITRCWIQPSIAPPYTPRHIPLLKKIVFTSRNLVPFSLIIFAIIGCLFLGIATPTESAAMGAIAAFILTIIYKRLSWKVVKEFTGSTARITIMLFMIVGGATAFSQILAYTGCTQGLVNTMTNLNIPTYAVISIMMVIVLFLGCFLDGLSILMITIPTFMPIILTLGVNPILYCLLLLINLETGLLTPPFGLGLFVMKGVAPSGTTMSDVCKAAIPFVVMNVVVIFLIMSFPQIALLLPQLMR